MHSVHKVPHVSLASTQSRSVGLTPCLLLKFPDIVWLNLLTFPSVTFVRHILSLNLHPCCCNPSCSYVLNGFNSHVCWATTYVCWSQTNGYGQLNRVWNIYNIIHICKRKQKEREREDTTRLTRHLHGCCPESLCLLAYFLGKSICFSTHLSTQRIQKMELLSF